MIGIEQYRKIQEYKALGLAQTKTAKALGITYSSVSKYWNMSEEDFVREAENERYHMDNYRQYILEHLKICPQMRDTNTGIRMPVNVKPHPVKFLHRDMKRRRILVNTNLRICTGELYEYISSAWF